MAAFKPPYRPLLLLAVPLFGAAVALPQSATAPSGDSAAQSQSQPAPPPPMDNSQQPPAAGVSNGSAASAKPSEPAGPPPSSGAMIAAGLPQYDPPKPEPAKPADQAQDLRDVDKPKNEIIRLPTYYVRTARQAVLKDPDLVTKKGAAAIGMKNHPGLGLFPFSWLNNLNNGIAADMYREDERLKNMSDLTETANAIGRGGDSAESEYIKRETQNVYMRGIDWGGFGPQN